MCLQQDLCENRWFIRYRNLLKLWGGLQPVQNQQCDLIGNMFHKSV